MKLAHVALLLEARADGHRPLLRASKQKVLCLSVQVHNVEALVSYKADEDDMM